MEVGCLRTWGCSRWPLTQVARTPQKPALPATQPLALPATPSPSPSNHHTEQRVQWRYKGNNNSNNNSKGWGGRGKWTLKLSNTQQDTLNTTHCKTTSTYKCAHLIATVNHWPIGHRELPHNRPSTVTQTLAKMLEHRITASSPKHANKMLTNTNARPTPR